MSTIIKAPHDGFEPIETQEAEGRAKAEAYLTAVRQHARTILADAHREADEIRRAAALEGLQEAESRASQQLAAQIDTLLPALREAVDRIEQTRDEWLANGQRHLVELASAIAHRIVRRELSREPHITLDLVREALELAAGRVGIRVLLNPTDFASLHHHVERMVGELSRLGSAEVVADENVTPGGCIVETQYGSIDERFESQLARIAEELM